MLISVNEEHQLGRSKGTADRVMWSRAIREASRTFKKGSSAGTRKFASIGGYLVESMRIGVGEVNVLYRRNLKGGWDNGIVLMCDYDLNNQFRFWRDDGDVWLGFLGDKCIVLLSKNQSAVYVKVTNNDIYYPLDLMGQIESKRYYLGISDIYTGFFLSTNRYQGFYGIENGKMWYELSHGRYTRFMSYADGKCGIVVSHDNGGCGLAFETGREREIREKDGVGQLDFQLYGMDVVAPELLKNIPRTRRFKLSRRVQRVN
jgi:hypothetical protein